VTRLVVTIAYAGLLAWGFSIGARQIYQGFNRPKELLNPLFGNRIAITMFTIHIVVVTGDLFIIGPWAVAHKSTLWYWGGRILLLNSSLPLAAYMNRNSQSFGNFIGAWVRFRNIFEYVLHTVFAAMALSWFRYYLLLWWLVAYRYLDVGPRRALQKLYDTPGKRAARPWAEMLNFGVILTIYGLTFLAVFKNQILFAKVPANQVAPHVPAHWETGAVVGANVALALVEWILIRKYTDSRPVQTEPCRRGRGSEQDRPDRIDPAPLLHG
jgi:predicted secreted protein